MSIKSYVVRIQEEDDVDRLDAYIKVIGEYVGWIDFIYQPTRRVRVFRKGEFAAAISVDRSDLRGSFAEEGIDWPHLCFEYLEDLPIEKVGSGYKVMHMEPCLDMNEGNWKRKIKRRLRQPATASTPPAGP